MSLNTCALLLSGTLEADVAVETIGGNACARFSVSTTYPYPGDDGQERIVTTRTPIVAFGALALRLRRLGMGSRVFLRGRLREASFGCGPARFHFAEVVAVSVHVHEEVPPTLAPTPASERPVAVGAVPSGQHSANGGVAPYPSAAAAGA